MNKNILITGAASGIGKATAEYFHQRGWQIGLLDINQESLTKLSQSLGPERVWQQALDVTDQTAVQQALSEFCALNDGQLHVLFNCAGILALGAFESIPLEKHQQIFNININGLMNLCYQAQPFLKKTEQACVINMSSASASYGVPYLASYSASKFAVKGLTEALNIEWQKHGIRVCDVMPPFVDTPMLQQQGNSAPALQRLGVKLSAESIAQTVWRSAHNNRYSKVHYPVSLFLKSIILLSKLSPAGVTRWIMQKIGT